MNENANDLNFKGQKNNTNSFYEYSICPFEISKFAKYNLINFKKDNFSNEKTNKEDSFCLLKENKEEIKNEKISYEDFNNMEFYSQGCIQFNNINNDLNNNINNSNDKIYAFKSFHPSLNSAIKEVENDDEKMEIEEENSNKIILKKKKYNEIPLDDNLNENYTLLKPKKFLNKDNNLSNIVKRIKNKKNKLKIEEEENNNNLNNNLLNPSELPDLQLLDQESLKEECKKYGIKYISNKNNKNSLNEIYTFLTTKNLPDYLRNNLTNFLNDNAEMESKVSKNLKNISSKSNVNIFDDEKKQQIINVIKNDKNLWSKILLFKTVDLKEIKDVLNKEKIIISNSHLKEFLSSLGVILPGGWNN